VATRQSPGGEVRQGQGRQRAIDPGDDPAIPEPAAGGLNVIVVLLAGYFKGGLDTIPNVNAVIPPWTTPSSRTPARPGTRTSNPTAPTPSPSPPSSPNHADPYDLRVRRSTSLAFGADDQMTPS